MKTFAYISGLVLFGLTMWVFKPEIPLGWYVVGLGFAIMYMDSTYRDKVTDLEFKIESIEERLSEIDPDNSSDYYSE